MAIVLVFGLLSAMPQSASANYGYYDNSYGSNLSGQYSYSRTTYVAPSPVYVTPTVVYAQPNPVVYVNQPVIYSQPVYSTPVYYQTLSVSCSANTTYSSNGSVTWTAYVSGGNGYYNYSWSGSDGISGYGQTINVNYSTAGQKYASVTVNSNGQTLTQSCSNTVNVSLPNYVIYQPTVYQQTYQPVVQQNYVIASNNNSGLDIGCYADPANSKVDQPITWNVEVKGGVGPYTYSWTGSEGLTGTQSTIIKYYATAGTKSAIVTVMSADGKTGVRACSNTLTVTSSYKAVAKAATVKTVSAPVANAAGTATQITPVVTLAPAATAMTAASLFSLQNVPWGWVAILIIAVLFFTVLYLLFNKTKI